jgi:hypothetical protein
MSAFVTQLFLEMYCEEVNPDLKTVVPESAIQASRRGREGTGEGRGREKGGDMVFNKKSGPLFLSQFTLPTLDMKSSRSLALHLWLSCMQNIVLKTRNIAHCPSIIMTDDVNPK